MKFIQTEFAKQLFASVVGTLFLVAGVAFVTFPGIEPATQTASAWHLT